MIKFMLDCIIIVLFVTVVLPVMVALGAVVAMVILTLVAG